MSTTGASFAFIQKLHFRCFALAALVLLTGFSGAGAASAQTAAVLDFAVAPGVERELGREASRDLWFEMARSGGFKPVLWTQVEAALGEYPAEPPYNDIAQCRLGQAVKAESIFTGTVLAAKLDASGAQVQIEVRQLDIKTGDYVNGGRALGTSPPQSTKENPRPLENALENAIATAMLAMEQTVLLQCTVIAEGKNGEVDLPMGTKQGVALSQRYTVTRVVFNRAKQLSERVKIGELEIRRVDAEHSTGFLFGCSTVVPGDQVRQIFDVCALARPPVRP
jgi:hypothetical protein